MFRYIFNAIGQDPWLPIFGLFLFILLFVSSIIWAISRDSTYIQKMSSLPIESDNQNGEQKNV